MNKTSQNYWLDIVIGIAFVASFVTGIAFLFMGVGGYLGGRNSAYAASFLGIARDMWRSLHTFTSFVMAAGVGLHLVFHFRWIMYVTKRKLSARVLKLPVQDQVVAREVTA